MKARIEKKLSKRLVQIAPKLFRDSWVDDERSDLAWKQGSSVSHVRMVGGGVNYWGEAEDAYTVWSCWRGCYRWVCDFKMHPAGHEFEGMPDIAGFRPTTKNLLRLAAGQEAKLIGRRTSRTLDGGE